jgi:hypothetical protein
MHTCTNHHALIRSLIAEIRGLRDELEIEQEHNYRNRQAAEKARHAAREALRCLAAARKRPAAHNTLTGSETALSAN